jgi:TolB-like protein
MKSLNNENMRKVILLICTMVFAWVGNMQAQDRMKIAVLDFKAGVGVSQTDVDGISAMLSTALFDTKKFTLVERTQIDKAISEQGFQKSSLTAKQIARIGEILGVQKVLVGDVNVVRNEYNIDVRIVDVETGVVGSTAGVTLSQGQTFRSMMPKLASELVGKMGAPAAVRSAAPAPATPAAPASNKMVTLYDYLHVFHEDLGAFSSPPTAIIANINKGNPHGYDDWRLPTMEELELLRNSRSKVGGLTNDRYWSSDKGALDFASSAVTAATGSYKIRLVTTGKPVAEKNAEASERREAERREAELRNSVPPHAASARTWTFGNQMWSDAIQIPACNKTSFTDSYTDPHCRSYTEESNTWYYYNWAYVNTNAATLCPAPWRVPTKAGFDALGAVTTAAELHAAWGYGGYAYGSIVYYVSKDGAYWSSWETSSGANFAYSLHYNRSHLARNGEYGHYGFQVRCVK